MQPLEKFIPAQAPAEWETEVKRLRALQIELETRQETESALSELADVIRVRPGEAPPQWAERWLMRLMDVVPGLQAAVYLADTPETDTLKLYATVAAPEGIAPAVVVGRGAIGQVVRSKRALYLDGDINLVSNSHTSLLQVKISALLIEPLVYNEVCTGVLEIGFMKPVSEAERSLVQRVAERVAATWLSLRDQIRIQTLWHEAQQKGEQLAAQEEELRQNLEEMQATQEELARRQHATETAIKTILSASADPIIITSDKGIILTFNPAAQAEFGFTEAEAAGQHISTLVPSLGAGGHLAGLFSANAALALGKTHDVEARCKNGGEFPAELSFNEAVVEGQHTFVGILRNVSERRAHAEAQQRFITELQATQAEVQLREREQQATLRGINQTLATIEFEMDGTILKANSLFLNAVGYPEADVVGQHHRMFLTPEDAASSAYGRFWKHLNEGKAQEGEFCRVGAGGRTVWLRATYTPILGPEGIPVRVMKLALDITAEKIAALEHAGHLTAIRRSTATVEFDMEGRLLWANDLFLNLMGYTLPELEGQPHSKFVKPADSTSAVYATLWNELRVGNYVTGEFERVRKDGKLVWIQGSYNPVMGPNGRPVKVVKVATDTTAVHEQQEALQKAFEEVQASEEEVRQQAEELQAIQEEMRRREQELQAAMRAIDHTLATIEFGMDGRIIRCNGQFAKQTGYKLENLEGQHHRKLLPKGTAETSEYAEFWKALNRAEAQEGSFVRVGANGKQVRMHATYTPVLNANGKPYKVIKLIQRIEPVAVPQD